MKKLYFLCCCFCWTSLGWSQIGIGTELPNSEAVLEIASTDKGVLLPKVSLQASSTFLNGISPVSAHQGMMVYNTNSDTSTGLAGIGYYFWDGAYWENFIGITDSGTPGQYLSSSLTGNTWIDPVSITDTDNQIASEVPFSPSGDITSTDVQAAIQELDTEKQAILPYGLGGNIFPIYGEQSTDLVDGVFDFSFGNGIINVPGIALPVSCELIGFGLSTDGTSSNIVEVYKNGVATGRRLNTNNTKKAYSNFITNPTQFVAGDVVNFLVVDGHSNSQAGIFVAWFRTTY